MATRFVSHVLHMQISWIDLHVVSMHTEYVYKSLTTGVCPDKPRVTPIPKDGDKCNLSNYTDTTCFK